MNSTDTKPRSKAEREAEEKAKRRAEAATIVAGLKQAIDADEQLLGFARGRLAGGIRGKLSLGPEAFFAPFVNIGLTERRLVIQHINAETGRPGEILPHFYALGDIAALTFSDIETFGGESAARLTVRLRNDQHTRLRLRGQSNFESAQAIVEVFRSLTSAQRPNMTPTQRICATCQHILDQPFKFCPYCGQQQDLTAAAPVTTPAPAAEPERSYPPTPPGPTEPDFLDAVPYQDAETFRGPTVEDGLEFMTSEPAPQPTVSLPEPQPAAVPEPEPSALSEAEPSALAEPEAVAHPEPEAVAAPEPEADMTVPSAEDSAFETPSAFEGWSVDPGATATVVTPSEARESTPPIYSDTVETPVAAQSVETEASVVEPTPEAALSPEETAEAAKKQTGVHSTVGATLPAVHPEAEFAPIPEPVVFMPAEPHSSQAFETPTAESAPVSQSEPMPHAQPEPALHPKPIAAPAPNVAWSAPAVAESYAAEAAPADEASPATPAEFDAPSTFESFAPTVPSADEPQEFAALESVAAAPTHGSAGFVTEPVAAEAPTPVSQDFESFAPVAETAAVPDRVEAASAPASPADVTPVMTPEPVIPPMPEAPPAPPAASSSEDRFAALLREIRGSDTPEQPAAQPSPAAERQDGPMSVNVHINRPPIVVNEKFDGRNAEEVVGKLKGRVASELNFAQRLMINSFSNVRFAQEVVRRYNEREKTTYPLPNSCWEFLLSAEEIHCVTIHLNS